MKGGKKNTAAAAQVIVRQEHYVLECMRKPQMCLGLLIFSPENEDSLFWRILAVYWHEKTASENIVFKMIG